jgi:hypothetical protein
MHALNTQLGDVLGRLPSDYKPPAPLREKMVDASYSNVYSNAAWNHLDQHFEGSTKELNKTQSAMVAKIYNRLATLSAPTQLLQQCLTDASKRSEELATTQEKLINTLAEIAVEYKQVYQMKIAME